ncbi:grpe protein [Anaeramoeba flamelloides]|uniref:Grpe protein n=1 Tax=Anaeramoeba flamelloides TaxID=1746091 RepID=A0AAV7Y4C9_9EUKA|nr:grpe protein [Anaeramoeba flamelloides]|eukprot:Anaeramoba_flamelloidesa88049_33.p1 GENE.a88049_33~~a88049_33.p1  ORF type:complete len:217 (-),score=57.77 a88049_33:56-706(-)
MLSFLKTSASQFPQVAFPVSMGTFKRSFTNTVENIGSSKAESDPKMEGETKTEKDEKTVLQERVEELAKELKESKDTLLRSLAETQNQSKRLRKQMKETRNFAVTDFSKSLLEIADNLDRALKNSPKPTEKLSQEYKSLHEGVVLTDKILQKVFAKFGIVPIDCKEGDKFDYKVHNAVLTIPQSQFNDGEVGLITQRGWKIKERVLRASRVGVVKK